ncbi:MAG: aminoacyltransferase, partial [Anaerolineae bacterium]|nr:aminoacyltransferase [Anaerolineae bacterium]
MLKHTIITDCDRWNHTLRDLPYAHVLQSWEWGQFKHATTGWEPLRLAFEQQGEIVALASIGVRRVGPLRVMYVTKGPALAYEDADMSAAVLESLQTIARQQRALWLKIDPDVIAATGVPSEEDDQPNATGQQMIAALQARGWRFSDDQVQFRNTITLDLTQSEDELLAQMSQNTRRKVRTGPKKGVTVRPGTLDDLPLLYELYKTTGGRDEFLIRPFDYYRQAWQTMM